MESALTRPDLLSAEAFTSGPPHDIFDCLRENDPVYGQPNTINGGTAWSLTRHADIRTVSTSTDLFTSTKGVLFPTPDEEAAMRVDNIVWHDPPRHQRQRLFAQKAFSPKVVVRFEEWIRGLCGAILDKVEDEREFDAIPIIALELPGQVICSIMGVPDNDRERVIGWGKQFFGRLDPEIGFEGSAGAMIKIRDYIAELAEIKRRNPGIDMTTELLGAEFEGVPITHDELTELAATLINAGFETTHTLIAQGLCMIAENPDIRLQVNSTPIEKMSSITEEMLRLISPIMHMMRTANADTVLNGQQISAGDRVLMWYTAGSRDPRVFEQPHEFNAQRKRNAHQAFGGGGPHFCLGNHLARLEAEILFDEMRNRNIVLELNGPVERTPSNFVNALGRLPMRLVRQV